MGLIRARRLLPRRRGYVTFARGGAVQFRLFGPSQEEINEVARDLIVRHGLDAYDEAIHLSEVIRLIPRSPRQRKIYDLAAVQIERSFNVARGLLRDRSTGASPPH
jgi:hypothetical protein